MEVLDFVLQYVPLDYVFIVGGLIVIGEMLKKFTTLPNQLLTTALPILGAILTGIIYGAGAEVFNMAEMIKQICIGLLIGWSATGGYEWFRNSFLTKRTEKKVISKEEIIPVIKEVVEVIDNQPTAENKTEENINE